MFRDDPDALATVRGRRRRRRRRAGALPARDVPPDRPGDRARATSRSTRATRRTTSQIGGDAHRASRRTTARRSCATSTTAGATATLEDFRNFVKLAYMSPYLHHSGGTVCEPVDIPVNKRHLDMVYAHIRYSDKPFMGSVTHPDRAPRHGRAWRASLFGERLPRRPHGRSLSLINANSPLVWDATMLGAARVYARGEPGDASSRRSSSPARWRR